MDLYYMAASHYILAPTFLHSTENPAYNFADSVQIDVIVICHQHLLCDC